MSANLGRLSDLHRRQAEAPTKSDGLATSNLVPVALTAIDRGW